jgi:transposase
MASVEVLAGRKRRRLWSIEQKQAIVAAAFEPGAVVRDVARRTDVIYCREWGSIAAD